MRIGRLDQVFFLIFLIFRKDQAERSAAAVNGDIQIAGKGTGNLPYSRCAAGRAAAVDVKGKQLAAPGEDSASPGFNTVGQLQPAQLPAV